MDIWAFLSFSGSDLLTCMLPTFCQPTIWTTSLEFYRKPCILAADDLLGACYRKAMTPKKLWTLLFLHKPLVALIWGISCDLGSAISEMESLTNGERTTPFACDRVSTVPWRPPTQQEKRQKARETGEKRATRTKARVHIGYLKVLSLRRVNVMSGKMTRSSLKGVLNRALLAYKNGRFASSFPLLGLGFL